VEFWWRDLCARSKSRRKFVRTLDILEARCSNRDEQRRNSKAQREEPDEDKSVQTVHSAYRTRAVCFAHSWADHMDRRNRRLVSFRELVSGRTERHNVNGGVRISF